MLVVHFVKTIQNGEVYEPVQPVEAEIVTNHAKQQLGKQLDRPRDRFCGFCVVRNRFKVGQRGVNKHWNHVCVQNIQLQGFHKDCAPSVWVFFPGPGGLFVCFVLFDCGKLIGVEHVIY